MNRRIAGCKLTLAVWPILFVLFLPSLMRGAGLELGSAKVEITPPVGYPMAGYAARKEARRESTIRSSPGWLL